MSEVKVVLCTCTITTSMVEMESLVLRYDMCVSL